jgi:DNA-binding GntR family transcriptional regulator
MLFRDRSELGTLLGEPGETLQTTLHRTLLEMILFGYFQKGARLWPVELARHFSVSLTPVREALMRLAAEGYIEATPRRGFHIRVPTAQQVVDLWQTRLGIELTAGEILIDKLIAGERTDADLQPLFETQAVLDTDPAEMTHHRHIELNGTFHRQLVAVCGNTMIVNIYDSIQQQLLGAWVQRGLESWRARFEQEAEDHRALLAALGARNHVAYASVVRRHIGKSLDGALSDLEAQKEL